MKIEDLKFKDFCKFHIKYIILSIVEQIITMLLCIIAYYTKTSITYNNIILTVILTTIGFVVYPLGFILGYKMFKENMKYFK